MPAIVVQETKRPITAVAHELGHLLGRPHASFACGAGDTDNNGDAEHWPPDEQGFLQGVGVDRRSFRVLFPDRTGGGLGGPFYDFMSYCTYANESVAWISTKGWMEELAVLAVGPPGSSASKQSAKRTLPSASASVVVVQAFIDQHENVSFGKIAAARRALPTSPAPPSEYHVQAFDARGRLIAESPMRVSVGHTDGTVHIIFLNAVIPARDVDAIQITRQGHPIGRRNRPAHAPEVEHVRVRAHHHPGKGDDADRLERSSRTVVTWHTEAGSAKSLTVKLDYSADGGRTWRPIFMGPDRGRASLRPQVLKPSLRARVRVRVSDGFNEVSAASAPFRQYTTTAREPQ
jgi:hypothetical protein